MSDEATIQNVAEAGESLLIDAPNGSQGQCVLCLLPCATKQCAICKQAYYCSERCRKLDGIGHSIVCAELSSVPERPTPDHKLALYFPSNETSPRYVWASTDGIYRNERTAKFTELFDLVDKLHGDRTYTWYNIFLNVRVRRPNPEGRSLILMVDKNLQQIDDMSTDEVSTDGTTVDEVFTGENLALHTIMRPFGVADFIPRGPCLLVLGHELPELDDFPFSCEHKRKTFDSRAAGMWKDLPTGDLKTGDIRPVIDFFLYIQRSLAWGYLQVGQMWGAIINCRGDPEDSNRPDRGGRELRLSAYNAVVDGDVSPLSEVIGIPLRLRPVPFTPQFHTVSEYEEPHYNPGAGILMTSMDIDDEDWGRPPESWVDENVGNVLVIRDDHGYIGTLPAMMIGWFNEELVQHIRHARFQGTREAREHAMRFITLDGLEAFRLAHEGTFARSIMTERPDATLEHPSFDPSGPMYADDDDNEDDATTINNLGNRFIPFGIHRGLDDEPMLETDQPSRFEDAIMSSIEDVDEEVMFGSSRGSVYVTGPENEDEDEDEDEGEDDDDDEGENELTPHQPFANNDDVTMEEADPEDLALSPDEERIK